MLMHDLEAALHARWHEELVCLVGLRGTHAERCRGGLHGRCARSGRDRGTGETDALPTTAAAAVCAGCQVAGWCVWSKMRMRVARGGSGTRTQGYFGALLWLTSRRGETNTILQQPLRLGVVLALDLGVVVKRPFPCSCGGGAGTRHGLSSVYSVEQPGSVRMGVDE
ncbi:hypothetical protein B0T22DRAFT_242965 [Podospora appendiculata]|uniref:Uncharacterized protein n=1 Tax=Podospora appendiculata TaxID=314037 RepID=A0AAE1CB40_9PEZI|nr:hypothetical protein B0T22DRAFT_242965 [Podospora appendiculata]